MAGPEQLQDEGLRLGRRRSWVVLGLVLVVLVGLAVFRFGRSDPDTAPRPDPTPSGAASPAPQAWPDDLPAGTLFAAADGRVSTIDAGRGAPTRTSVRADPADTSMTASADGVLVWQEGGDVEHAALTEGGELSPVRGELRSATSFLPGPDGLVWARGRVAEKTTWHLVDADGRVAKSLTVDGPVSSDGSGGLLSVGDRSVRPLFPGPRSRRQQGELVATGPDGYVVRSCTEPDCRFTLHQHKDGSDTELQTAVGADTSGGTLSPANRLLAVTETVGGTSTLRVSVVATGEVKFIFPTPKESTSDAVWLDERWLALISEDQLVLYDADDDRVVTPALPLRDVGPLAWKAA